MRHGITIDRYDYSEPQSGEDVCDRIICPLKASIRKYCNEGHDIVTAQDMCTALNERPVKGTTATVCSIKEQFQTLQMNKIPDYSSLHNFEFSEGGLRVWKAFGVGPESSFRGPISFLRVKQILWRKFHFLQRILEALVQKSERKPVKAITNPTNVRQLTVLKNLTVRRTLTFT